jgi:head-tail adaptor
MKVTKEKLRNIIKEELASLQQEMETAAVEQPTISHDAKPFEQMTQIYKQLADIYASMPNLSSQEIIKAQERADALQAEVSALLTRAGF